MNKAEKNTVATFPIRKKKGLTYKILNFPECTRELWSQQKTKAGSKKEPLLKYSRNKAITIGKKCHQRNLNPVVH